VGVIGDRAYARLSLGSILEPSAPGNEVGYHYEELADVVKERGAATTTQARALIGVARDRARRARR
jgi:hypothetical protein